MATKQKKEGTITASQREDAARLLSIWNSMLPTLRSRGCGTQKAFGKEFGIGSQSAVALFLSGKSALSLKAAAAFARGLDCRVSDFSPTLGALLYESSNGNSPREALGDDDLLNELIRRIELVPRERRVALAEEISLLVRAPRDSGAMQAFLALLGDRENLEKKSEQTFRSDFQLATRMLAEAFARLDGNPEASSELLVRLDFFLVNIGNPSFVDLLFSRSVPLRS